MHLSPHPTNTSSLLHSDNTQWSYLTNKQLTINQHNNILINILQQKNYKKDKWSRIAVWIEFSRAHIKAQQSPFNQSSLIQYHIKQFLFWSSQVFFFIKIHALSSRSMHCLLTNKLKKMKNVLFQEVKESKKKITWVISLSGSVLQVNGVHSVPRSTINPNFVKICSVVFVYLFILQSFMP